MAKFIRNLWYVAAWDHEVALDEIVSRTIIGEPLAIFRNEKGEPVVFEDRCPHRHAPLSMGRLEREGLRCMYHGLIFNEAGVCTHVPAADMIPPNAQVRRYPVVERSNWIWVWMGEPSLADPAQIPEVSSMDDPIWVKRASALDYAADYQLLNDNLCDLSHLDYTHETSLGALSRARWSDDHPKMIRLDNGLRIERWLLDVPGFPDVGPEQIDIFNSYEYLLPGLFLMRNFVFGVGAAARWDYGAPQEPCLFETNLNQQAVTPIGPGRSRYLYAAAMPASAPPSLLDELFTVINTAFGEDKQMIEAQQLIWNQTEADQPKIFLPQDKAPAMFRRLIERRISEEQASPRAEPSDQLHANALT